MDRIATIEDAMIAQCIAALTLESDLKIKSLGNIPGAMTIDILKRILKSSPGVFVSFIRATSKKETDSQLIVQGQFNVTAVTTHHSGEEERRRGDKTQIGAYEIIERVAAKLHSYNITNIGSLTCQSLSPLFNQGTYNLGASIYIAEFTIPMVLESEVDSTLDEFETFHVDYDIPTHETLAEHNKWLQEPPDYDTSEPDAQGDTTLEQ